MKKLTLGTVSLLLSFVFAIGYTHSQTITQNSSSVYESLQETPGVSPVENSVLYNSIYKTTPPPVNILNNTTSNNYSLDGKEIKDNSFLISSSNSEKQFKAFSSGTGGFSNFSGGDGQEATPFLISTPKDLIDLSKAVNSKATYTRTGSTTPYNYSDAYYKLTQDIDMGKDTTACFIICTHYMAYNLDKKPTKNTDTVFFEQTIFPANNSSFPLQFTKLSNDKTTLDKNTLTDSNDVAQSHEWVKDGDNSPNSLYRHHFEYRYYGNTTVAMSALMNSIGYVVIRHTSSTPKSVQSNMSKPFKGYFDGDGHTISNLEMLTTNSVCGLFGYVAGTSSSTHNSIKNLNINNAYISSSDNTFAGGIAALISYTDIINCNVTNSTIRGNQAGAIGSVFQHSGSTDNGTISNCTSANNQIIGSENAGGIIGSSTQGIVKINNCISSNNTITADDESHTGPISGTWGWDKDQGSNTVISSDEIAKRGGFVDIIMDLANGKIPDFCYINSGVSMDSVQDKARLNRLEAELNGSSAVTYNLVLPDTTKIKQFIDKIKEEYDTEKLDELCSTYYENSIEWIASGTQPSGSISAQDAFNGTNGVEVNRYYYNTDDQEYKPHSGNISSTQQYYFKVTDNSGVVYYKYRKNSNNSSNWTTNYPRFTKVKGDKSTTYTYFTIPSGNGPFQYYLPGWESYSDSKKTEKRNDLLSKINKVKNDIIPKLPKYYKLSAEGTDANPIVIDVTMGGGIYDKGNQLGDKIVRLKKYLDLQNWTTVGITKIEEMGNGWDTLPMDKKVNFLSNTEDVNDIAAIDWDYTTNNWPSQYLLSKKDLPYGKGIFVWSYNTSHPLVKEGGEWDFETTTTHRPILYQQGKVKAYVDTVATNTEINNYISSLENTGESNGSGATMGKWFFIANPYTAVMSVEQILKHLTNNGEGNAIQGNCIYKYTVNSVGQGGYITEDTRAIVYAGDAFFVAIAEDTNNPENKLSGSISSQDLYGFNYEPIVSLSKKSAIENKSQTNTLPKNMTFLCADSKKGVAQMTAFRYDGASNGFDVNDAYAMLSTADKHAVEPFFVVDDVYLRHNAFTSLPYEVPIGFSSQTAQQVTFSLMGATDSIDVYLMDAVADTIICNMKAQQEVIGIEGEDTVSFSTVGTYATLNVEQGKNEGKYKIHFGPYTVGIENSPNAEKQFADINIYNVNKHVYLKGENLKRVQVLNTLGQVVFEKQLSGNEYSFKLNVVSGAYIVKALNEDGFAKSEKIIVQ